MAKDSSPEKRGFGGLVFLFLALYLATLCPTVFRGDSGEIVLAIWSQGVVHPPGYPLFTLLGRLFLLLVPVGEPAFRLGVLVALCGALAVGYLYRVLRELEVTPLAALGAASIFGVSLTFWSQCNRVEVYSLHLLFVNYALWQCLRYRNGATESALYKACLSVGLGLAHHLTLVLLVPGLLLLCGKRVWHPSGLLKRLAIGLVCLLLTGLPLYLLLLGHAPGGFCPVGAPHDQETLWNHVSGKVYQSHLAFPSSGDDWTRVSRDFRRIIEDNNFIPLGIVAVFGGLQLLKKNPWVFLALVVVAAGVISHAISYDIADISPYYLPFFVVGTILAGVCLGSIDQWLKRQDRHVFLQLLVCFSIPVMYLVMNFPSCNLHQARGVALLAKQKLTSCPDRAVLICRGDEDANSVTYAQSVLKIRPDIIVLDQPSLDNDGFLSWLKAKNLPFIDEVVAEDSGLTDGLTSDRYLIRLLRRYTKDRPLYSTFSGISSDIVRKFGGSDGLQWILENYTPAPYGVVLKLYPKKETVSIAQVLEECRVAWKGIELPDIPPAIYANEIDGDYTRRHYATMLCNYGFLYEASGQPKQAESVYLVALSWAPESAREILERMKPRSPVAKRLLPKV